MWGVIRIAIGLLLLLACYAKAALTLEERRQQVARFRILPERFIAPTALLIPVVEGVLGANIVLGVGVRMSLACAATLFIVFVIVGCSVLMRKLHVSCGCFGKHSRATVSWVLVLRNMLIAVLCLYLAERDWMWSVAEVPPLTALALTVLLLAVGTTTLHLSDRRGARGARLSVTST